LSQLVPLTDQQDLLEKVAVGAPLDDLLDSLLRLVEAQLTGALGAILLLDADGLHLRHGAAPRLPDGYSREIDGLAIGEGAAACGTAAFRRQAIIAEDIATDPRWETLRDLAAAHGLRACWSTPIFDAQRQVLGTLDLYFHAPRRPGEHDRRLIEKAAQTAAIVIARRREEEALLASRELLHDLIENSQDLICTHDLTGRILSVNRAAERMAGFSRDEFLRMSIADLLAPEVRSRFDGYLDELRTTGQARGIMRIRTAAGETRYWEYNNSLRREGLAAPIVRGLARDVTERVAAEAQRTQLEAELRHAQKMEGVGRLAGGLAHDFNNLLTVICGTAELAMGGLPAGDPLRAPLQEIRHAGERASELTRQLLAFSRKQILQPVILNLNSVVSDLGTMLRRLIGEDVELTFLPAADLAPVKADAGQLEQVIMNLAVNARDAMPNGGRLTIETGNAEVLAAQFPGQAPVPPGLYVILAITDTGSGMDEATRERIFEPFFTTKEAGKGTGLGLSTVYGIVQQSGGGVSVHSGPGAGSTFTIFLPRAEAQPCEEPPRHSAPTPRGGETVLVVEDEGALRRLAQAALESAGYRVLTAANGREALRLLEDPETPVRLVLTDMVMPEMGGRELAKALACRRPGIKVLFTSGYEDALVRHGVAADGAHFIGKPFSVDELARKVREVLDTAA
jgi:PAS domain S-box-containing protein